MTLGHLPTNICTVLRATDFLHVISLNLHHVPSRSCCGLRFTAEETAPARGLDLIQETGSQNAGPEPNVLPQSLLGLSG